MTTIHTAQAESFDTLEELVRRGIAGERAVVPAIKQLLDHSPELWKDTTSLVAQTEYAWLQAMVKDDLVAREILFRQFTMMKAELLESAMTPLEKILVETICMHWLQLRDAQIRVGKYMQHYGYVSGQHEKRLAVANKLFLSATKSLAQVQRLLRPKAPTVSIANQQVINMPWCFANF